MLSSAWGSVPAALRAGMTMEIFGASTIGGRNVVRLRSAMAAFRVFVQADCFVDHGSIEGFYRRKRGNEERTKALHSPPSPLSSRVCTQMLLVDALLVDSLGLRLCVKIRCPRASPGCGDLGPQNYFPRPQTP